MHPGRSDQRLVVRASCFYRLSIFRIRKVSFEGIAVGSMSVEAGESLLHMGKEKVYVLACLGPAVPFWWKSKIPFSHSSYWIRMLFMAWSRLHTRLVWEVSSPIVPNTHRFRILASTCFAIYGQTRVFSSVIIFIFIKKKGKENVVVEFIILRPTRVATLHFCIEIVGNFGTADDERGV